MKRPPQLPSLCLKHKIDSQPHRGVGRVKKTKQAVNFNIIVNIITTVLFMFHQAFYPHNIVEKKKSYACLVLICDSDPTLCWGGFADIPGRGVSLGFVCENLAIQQAGQFRLVQFLCFFPWAYQTHILYQLITGDQVNGEKVQVVLDSAQQALFAVFNQCSHAGNLVESQKWDIKSRGSVLG